MAECWRCPYTYDIRRRFGTTVHCNLELANMDVTYYCNEKRKNEENLLCPFINPRTRLQGVDYRKYETKFLEVRG